MGPYELEHFTRLVYKREEFGVIPRFVIQAEYKHKWVFQTMSGVLISTVKLLPPGFEDK